MKVYLDVSCLNRPFDDQTQARIRLEAEAVAIVVSWIDAKVLTHVASDMSRIEIDAMKDSTRRRRVTDLLPKKSAIISLSASIMQRARALESFGLKAADAVHTAAAEAAEADVFLTCDDRLLASCRNIRPQLRVEVNNPLDWVKERDHDSNN